MGLQKFLEGTDFCSSISFRDRPSVDENDPGVRPFLPCPEPVQEHEISHISGHECSPFGAGEAQEFGIGSLIRVGAEIEYRNHIVSAFP